MTDPRDPSDPMTDPTAGWTTPPSKPASRVIGPRPSGDARGPSVLFGLILVAVGLWFFAEQTLGLDLPELRWRQLWPLILIVVGAWVLLGARRGSR